MKSEIMKYFRGGMWWCDFGDIEETSTREIKKKRPCIIVSSNEYNGSSVFQVIPTTTTVSDSYSKYCVEIPSFDNRNEKSMANVIQMRAMDFKNFEGFIGILPEEYMSKIDAKICDILGLKVNTPVVKPRITVEHIEEDEQEDVPANKCVIRGVGDWSLNKKKNYISDYENKEIGIDDVLAKYDLVNKKSAQNAAYKIRKELGLVVSR